MGVNILVSFISCRTAHDSSRTRLFIDGQRKGIRAVMGIKVPTETQVHDRGAIQFLSNPEHVPYTVRDVCIHEIGFNHYEAGFRGQSSIGIVTPGGNTGNMCSVPVIIPGSPE